MSKVGILCSGDVTCIISDDNIAVPQHVIGLSDSSLRRRLTDRGEQPGPMTSHTRRVYERRLARLLKDVTTPSVEASAQKDLPCYSLELRRMLRVDGNDDVTGSDDEALLDTLALAFVDPNPNRKWREGTEKKSFNYLLLDPRVTRNLPARARSQSE